MRSPLSSPSCIFSCSTPSLRTRSAAFQRRLSCFHAPFGRRSPCLQNAPPRSGILCSFVVKRRAATPRTGGFTCRDLAHIGANRACDAGDSLLYVSARVFPWGSRPKHHNLYSPTGDPPKPGTGTTLLSRGGLSANLGIFRPPGPVLDATLPSFHLFSLNGPPGPLLALCYTCWPGEAESALQACTRRGIPRPTAHQRCQAPEAPVSGAVFFSLQAAGFLAFWRMTFDCQSTSLAPAGTSPRSR